MTPEEVAAVSRVSPGLAPYIVLSVPLAGVVAWMTPGLKRVPFVRRACVRWLDWDPGDVADDTGRRTMALMDQMQEELAGFRAQIKDSRALLERYAADIDQLRQARVVLLLHVGELRDAAIAARTQVHGLQRQFGLPETDFDPLPGITKEGLLEV